MKTIKFKIVGKFKSNILVKDVETEELSLNIIYMSKEVIVLESRFFSDIESEYYSTLRKWKGMYYISSAIRLKHTTFEKMVKAYYESP